MPFHCSPLITFLALMENVMRTDGGKIWRRKQVKHVKKTYSCYGIFVVTNIPFVPHLFKYCVGNEPRDSSTSLPWHKGCFCMFQWRGSFAFYALIDFKHHLSLPALSGQSPFPSQSTLKNARWEQFMLKYQFTDSQSGWGSHLYIHASKIFQQKHFSSSAKHRTTAYNLHLEITNSPASCW